MILLRPLSHRPFALLWSGQTISRLGDALYRLALGWWVLNKTGSAAIMSTVYIVSFAPMLVFLLIGGVVADRLPRLRVMFWADVMRGIITLTLAVLALSNILQVWHVLVASAAFGLAEAFFEPAFVSSIPSIAPGELLPSANSLESLSRQLAAIIGPTLGAILVATGGNGVAFAINALSFFISAACVLPILHIELPVVQSPRRLSFTAALCQMRDDLRAGFRAVTSSYWLWVTIVVAAFGNICIGAVRTIGTPLLVRELLAGNVTVLGFLTTVAAVAGIVAATIVGSIKRLRFRGIVYYVGYIVAGIGLVSMSIQMSVVGVLPGMVLLGAMPPVLGLIWTNTLQQNIPREKLGRVNSVDMLGSFALLPIGYGLVGWYGDLVGAARLFLAAGLVAVVLGLVGLSVREVRRLD